MTDEKIHEGLATVKPYSLLIFKPGPTPDVKGAEQIQWQHLQYLFNLRSEGKMLVTCPVTVQAGISGIGILTITDMEEAKEIFDNDPNVKAGRLVYEVLPCMGIPGDGL